jgi:acetamidase/formamidase
MAPSLKRMVGRSVSLAMSKGYACDYPEWHRGEKSPWKQKKEIERPEGGNQKDRQVVRGTGISFPCEVTGRLTPVGNFDMHKKIEDIQHP